MPIHSCTNGAIMAPKYTPGNPITHSAIGTSCNIYKCSKNGQRDVHPPIIILVTTLCLAGSCQTNDDTKNEVTALPIPMCATSINPARKEQMDAMKRVLHGCNSDALATASELSSFVYVIEKGWPALIFCFPTINPRSTNTETASANMAKSDRHSSGGINGRNVPMVAPIHAGRIAAGMISHAITRGFFFIQFKNPKTPFPKVMVDTAKAVPSLMWTPNNSRIGTKTMPPPTGTALASVALHTPRRGMG
mmetsp:Transcript_24434/g.51857  ORF Transcript_24434/g.51857 Transcript_24434/m.51857 type:complete len:249 (+) Transcript_24434:163-909(+)